MSKKSKKPSVIIPEIHTVEGLNVAVNRYVEVATDLARRKAKAEIECARIMAEFEADNAERMAEVDALTAAAHMFCEDHQDVLDRGRSVEFANAVVGFRKNPPKVEKRISKDTFEAIVRRMQAQEWALPFLRTPEQEIDKDLLISERANLDPKALAAVGLKIEQAETFYIAPKGETAETAKIVA